MPTKRFLGIILTAAVALGAGYSLGVAAGKGLQPPERPKRERRKLTTATDLARDLALVVDYLERGQSFYRAYQRGTHSVEENKRFLRFLEHYEKELAVAVKEVDTLQKWVDNRGSLDTID